MEDSSREVRLGETKEERKEAESRKEMRRKEEEKEVEERKNGRS